jgi:uncharacterized protein YjdB
VLNKANVSLTAGDKEKLVATTYPAGETVTWTSSNTDVATVSATGEITAVAAGTATITATMTVDTVDYSDTCAVTVASAGA